VQRLLSQRVDSFVEFRNQFVECFLELVGLFVLLLLKAGDDLVEGGDHLICLVVVVEVLLAGLVESVLLQHDVELAQQVDFVADGLKLVVDDVEVALLNHEFFHVRNISPQNIDRLT